MKVLINLPFIYHKLNPIILHYIYKNGEIVGYHNIDSKKKVAIIQFYDLTRIWILENELKYFIQKTIRT